MFQSKQRMPLLPLNWEGYKPKTQNRPMAAFLDFLLLAGVLKLLFAYYKNCLFHTPFSVN
jgi:hypothetical protein